MIGRHVALVAPVRRRLYSVAASGAVSLRLWVDVIPDDVEDG